MSEPYPTYFTDFGGRFKARLANVFPARSITFGNELTPYSAKYDCRIKVQYQKDIMRLLEEGMLVAVRNFKAQQHIDRFTMMVVSRVYPEHFGLKGLSDHTYYPMSFEIIEQSLEDWKTDDRSTMMVQISAIPINYDLTIKPSGELRYEKGFSYPILAEEAHLLNSEMINQMYNQKIVQRMDLRLKGTSQEARKDPRLGTIKMFESAEQDIPIYVDFEKLVRFHFGVFSFTGGGKSNLLSNILRRILLHRDDIRVVIFDISSEYPFLLMDIFADEAISSKIIFDFSVKDAGQFAVSIVKPRDYENDPRTDQGLAQILSQGKVDQYIEPRFKIPSYGEFLSQLDALREDAAGKPHYSEAIETIRIAVADYIAEKGPTEAEGVDEVFVAYISQKAADAVQSYGVHEKSGLYSWANTRGRMIQAIRQSRKQTSGGVGLTIEDIRKGVEHQWQITCISITDPYTIKELLVNLTRDFLARRKRQFKVKPYILFVFDEAQEFIPDYTTARGIEKSCTKQVETLLRQGRKYGLGGCVATQRIAYLNTNALQQLHTYFVGTLPRPYDRTLVSNTFTIDQAILEKTLEFAPGEWLLSSYIATGMENVPIFIKADNAEEEVERFLKQT